MHGVAADYYCKQYSHKFDQHSEVCKHLSANSPAPIELPKGTSTQVVFNTVTPARSQH